ncbi:hypothetical protein JB92DRAFT_2950198 [Gautieria morchelliformis]|nr:hypothetical protein JB92DRAFT_2949864 [Gautieria morchelliformis]KAF8508969.1 hypothetical protein JB92DRAFT_2950198 [Gautieria morchelliformis]
MVEPVSMAATIIAVLNITNVAVQACCNFRNASKDKAGIIQQLSVLERLLDGILQTMGDPPVPLPIMQQLLQEDLPSRLRDLRHLKKKLETPGGRTARLLASLCWTLREASEVKKTLCDLRDFQSMLCMAMAADNLNMTMKHIKSQEKAARGTCAVDDAKASDDKPIDFPAQAARGIVWTVEEFDDKDVCLPVRLSFARFDVRLS